MYLRKLGFNISLKGNRKQTPQQKSAVTRLYGKVSGYTEDNRFKFFKLQPSKRRKLKGIFSKNTLTPRGVFIQIPKGVPRSEFKLSVSRRGGVRLQGKGMCDSFIAVDPEKLAVDPQEAFKTALGKRNPQAVKLVVNGYESRTEKSKGAHAIYDLEVFFGYFNELHQAMTAEPGEYKGPIKRNQKRAYTDEEFADIFHLKLIY